MSNEGHPRSVARIVAAGAVAVGLAAGSYGIASAASGSAATTTAAATPATTAATGQPWGGQRSDETLLTGDAATKVRDAALAKVGGGATIVRVETDADGHAAYEAHVVQQDGTRATVYVDKQFDVVSVETR
jgi:uncharacterized membrane protein YkoI